MRTGVWVGARPTVYLERAKVAELALITFRKARFRPLVLILLRL